MPFPKIIKHFQTLISSSGENPILIDGLSLDWKHIDNWVALNGPPVVFNLKTDEKELIRRTRRKNEADVNAEVTEEEGQKAKEAIAKNAVGGFQGGFGDDTDQVVDTDVGLDGLVEPFDTFGSYQSTAGVRIDNQSISTSDHADGVACDGWQ